MLPCILALINSAGVNTTKKYLQCITTIVVQISAATIMQKNNPKISLFCHFLTTQNKHLQQLLIYTQKQEQPPFKDGKRHRENTAISSWNKNMTIF